MIAESESIGLSGKKKEAKTHKAGTASLTEPKISILTAIDEPAVVQYAANKLHTPVM
jgi:hypothetical protein